ncbi:MAG: hypothetical protein JWR24_905 [Actinoallomurus sp.]|nr:hypothetical protein [Actinoallomurus sp.]
MKPSPPVAVLTACNGGSSAVPTLVPPWRAEGVLARTAVVAAPVSVPWNVVPSVDHDGVHPGGTFSEPGTYVCALEAPLIGSVMVAAAGLADPLSV